MKPWPVIAVVAAVLAGTVAPATAQLRDRPSGLDPARWLPEGADLSEALSSTPRQRLRSVAAGGQLSDLAQLGQLAFRSPQVFGGQARRAGLTCQTCHPAGHRNANFFVPGLSSLPGSFDTSNGLFNAETDDGRLNALDIPSLRGVAFTGPYGRDGRMASLREFVRHVVVVEFAGGEPPPWLLDALLAYLGELDYLAPGPAADAAAAGRGSAIFYRPFPGRPDLSCAACHPPGDLATDRRQHDIGTGGRFDTPGLLNAATTAPYFHDGRAPDLAAVVAHFDRQFGLGLSQSEQADLLRYLEQLAGEAKPVEPAGLAGALADVERFLPLVRRAMAQQHDARLTFVVSALRHQLGLIHERLRGSEAADARRLLVEWSRSLAAIGDAWLASGPDGEGLRLYEELRRKMADETPTILAVEASSLYAAAALKAAFPKRPE